MDPDTRLSDRAWAHKFLQKASISRKEKYDVYYSAGAIYDPLAIEKALRVRCAQVHVDEKRLTSRPHYKDKEKDDEVKVFKKKKIFIKKRMHGTHHTEQPLEEYEEDPMEQEPEDDKLPDDLPEEEDDEQEEEADNETSEGEMEEGELKEAFAAGWKAKQKIADIKRHRGWKTDKKGDKGGNIDARKKATTCSSCGKQGHWRGDPECPNVISGRDQLHKPAQKTSTVHFTYMVGQEKEKQEKREKQCPQCYWPILDTSKFCSECGYALSQDDRMAPQSKREKEDDQWDVVEGGYNAGFAFPVTTQSLTGAKPKAKAKALVPGVPPGQVRLQGQELMAALPSMSKDEKKALHQALKDDEDKETERRRQMYKDLMDQWSPYDDWEPGQRELFPEEPWKFEEWQQRMKMREAATSGSNAAGSQDPLPPAPRQDKPKAVKEKELNDFRRQLYDRQVRNGRCHPSSAADHPTEAQYQCSHPFENLRWSANAEGHFARCRLCDLKHVVYFSHRHGIMVATSTHDPPAGVSDKAKVWIREDEKAAHYRWVNKGGPLKEQVSCRVTKDMQGHHIEIKFLDGNESMEELTKPLEGPARPTLTEFWYEDTKNQSEAHEIHFIQGQKPGLAIADSGSRNSVGGQAWHDHLQEALKAYGVPWKEVKEKEVYKFGAGAPITSNTGCLYPVMIHGQPDIVRMSIVGKGGFHCPGLIGPGELSRWNAVFHFRDKMMELNGVKKEMRLTATRHPGIELLDFDEAAVKKIKEFWESEEAEKKRKILQDVPQSYAFLATEETATETEDSEEPSEMEEDEREKKVKEWMEQLGDLGVTMVPTIPAKEEDEEEKESDDGSSEEQASSTSHEKGVDFLTEESESDEDQDPSAQKTYVAEVKTAHKSIRHRLGHASKEIEKTFREELSEQKKRKAQEKKEEEKKSEEPRREVKRKRNWTVVEIFSWTCAISIMATMCHWQASEPISLPHWDILKEKDRADALTYLDALDPDLMVIAWPCTVWSPLQGFGHKSPWQRQRLEERREEQREILGFVRDASHGQRRRGGLLLGENPKPSLAWKEPLIVEAFDGMASTTTDMCQYGLRIPDRGPFLRKRTRLAGTPALVKQLGRLCPGKHTHTPVLGGMHHQGRWMNVSDYAGGYTAQFAKQVIATAQEVLEAEGRIPEALVEGGEFPEEDLIEEDSSEEEEKKEVKEWKKKEETPQSWRLEQLHNRLGHLTNNTLAKMLSLSGASKEVIQRAMHFECPHCQETKAPGRYMKASPTLRTTIFGRELHCDLKYLHDCKGKLFVALSMTDVATSYQQAVILKNRSAEHVARKCLRHWISLHGAPHCFVLDQGGEFDGHFVSFLEQHGIHSKTTGAKSAWQHGFAERHGALLGTMFTSLVWQFKIEGKSQVKDALCAAIQAKNSTITKGGYTPYQLAFGRHPLFPDLLDEDVEGNMSLREALTLEGEFQRAAQMRAAARATLLRHDVQAKLRKALRRWPKGEERDFEPGELVYFYAPKPLSTRFKKEPGFWRGPAMILVKESHQRFFVS